MLTNHSHLQLRNRPDLLRQLTDEEAAERIIDLFPYTYLLENTPEGRERSIKVLLSDMENFEKLRWRLSDISWFMRCLNEKIATKANKEDNVTGSFWEGRFKATRLDDESARLSCMVYIDLNEIRAGVAKTPEESTYTSAHKRIHAREAQQEQKQLVATEGSQVELTSKYQQLSKRMHMANWLTPISDTTKKRGALSISLNDYLEILDATGRVFRHGKRGAIPDNLAPILKRLDIEPEHWIETVGQFDSFFARVAGKLSTLRQAAEELGCKWLKGVNAAGTIFISH